MKTIFALSLLTLAIPSFAQINLAEEKRKDTLSQTIEQNVQEQRVEQMNSAQSNRERVQKEVEQNGGPTEEMQKSKFAAMSQFILMNAAVVGYGKACGMPKAEVDDIEKFFVKRYQLENDKYILSKYQEKITEFENSKPKKDECAIFTKEFKQIHKNVKEYR